MDPCSDDYQECSSDLEDQVEPLYVFSATKPPRPLGRIEAAIQAVQDVHNEHTDKYWEMMTRTGFPVNPAREEYQEAKRIAMDPKNAGLPETALFEEQSMLYRQLSVRIIELQRERNALQLEIARLRVIHDIALEEAEKRKEEEEIRRAVFKDMLLSIYRK